MGLLSWLRKVGTPWLGEWGLGKSEPALRGNSVQTRVAPGGYGWFLPYLDDRTGETAAHRKAYRLMLKDPTIKAALLDKTNAVATLDLAMNADGDSDVDKQAAEFCRYSLARVTNGDFALVGLAAVVEAVILPGLIDGFSVCEKVWCPVTTGKWTGKVRLKSLKWKDPERDIGLKLDDYDNIVGLVGAGLNASKEYDTANFVVWRHMSVFDSPGGMSDLRAAYRAYWLIDTAWKLRARHLEKFSSPMMKGTYASTDQKAPLEAALERARAATWISVPEGAMVEAMDLAMRGTADFKAAIDDLRQDVYLGIVGAMLQAMQGTTSDGRGNSETHKKTTDGRKWHLSECLRSICDGQINPDTTELNFAGATPPMTALGGISEQELQQALTVDQGLYNMDVPLSLADIHRRYNRPSPKDEADTLRKPSMVAQPEPTLPSLEDEGPDAVVTPSAAGEGEQSDAINTSDLRATVGGSNAIAALQKSYYDGSLPREAVIANATQVFGFGQEEAEKLFPPVAPTKLTPDDGAGAGTTAPVGFSDRVRPGGEELAVETARRWRASDPDPTELDKVDKKLEGTGWTLSFDQGQWQARRLEELAA